LIQGSLFSSYFLEEGVRETAAWQQLSDEDDIFARLHGIFNTFQPAGADEATTEDDLIRPVLEALGYSYTRQKSPNTKGRADVPDFLLFADDDHKTSGLTAGKRMYAHGCAILEAKRWARPLDRGDATDPMDARVPANQMLRYLSSADVASNGGIRFGILTNGRRWRLYDHRAPSRAEAYLDIDLFATLGLDAPNLLDTEAKHRRALRLFVLFFRKHALPPPAGCGLLMDALHAGQRFEAGVAGRLRETIFETVFPKLAEGFAANMDTTGQDDLPQLYHATLVLLYRLLFISYAEDRNLLPAGSEPYDDYSLRHMRDEIERRTDMEDTFSDRRTNFYRHLLDLFDAINRGDDSIGIPPYNGGLFSPERHPFLNRHAIADAYLAPALDALSRVQRDGRKLYVNYRDMDVRRLGSIYEGLLEYRLCINTDGNLVLEHDTYARKNTGSYYTHDDLVQLCIRQSLAPLLDAHLDRFGDAADKLRHEKTPKAERRKQLEKLSPASAALSLRVCDPAMGSGHFLVAVVDWLADEVLVRMELETEAGAFCDYVSPLEARIGEIRRHVLDEAARHGWKVDESKLEDRHIVKRMVLKRVIFGVDINPMAVELAKLALWLHSFTMGAPLSFLDHHLKCGNSLVGVDPKALTEALSAATLFGGRFQGIYNAASFMEHIAELSDADIADVKQSAEFYSQAQQTIEPLWKALDVYCAHDFLIPLAKKAQKGWGSPRQLLEATKGDPLKVAAGEEPLHADDEALRQSALDAAARQRFLHWKLAFPEVWFEHGRPRTDPGFDVILGNPPWDRIKLQENEFFALRDPNVAHAATASERKRLIKLLPLSNIDLYEEYQQASGDAMRMARHARDCGEFPYLAGGDPNLYALFVERGMSLLRKDGHMSLVVPSGIVADKEKARFFARMVEAGRVVSVYDFENKKVFFPEVHASFKFCVFTLRGVTIGTAAHNGLPYEGHVGQGLVPCQISGTQKTAPRNEKPPIRCGFFLHHVDETKDKERTFELAPDDLARINPNTKTLPVFRTRRDAELTRSIYEKVPALIRRDDKGYAVANPWGVRFLRMFDMTNDSHLFRTTAALEAAGFYRVRERGQPVYKKGDKTYLRLYEGKMVQMYDHRAANIVVNPENIHRPAQPEPATAAQHADSDWTPEPQFWVPMDEVQKQIGNSPVVLGFKGITAPTNIRTMIPALHPYAGFGNSLFMILPEDKQVNFLHQSALLQAMLASFVVDYVTRQKVQGQNLNFFIVEQLPILPPETFDRKMGGHPLSEWISRQVLELTYASEDMRPFAEAMGYSGNPFPWGEERRRHLMTRLDALFFHLYEVDRAEAAYVLDTFPIVRHHDEKQFGRYRTKDMVLAYMNAVKAGDLDAVLDV